MKTYYDTCRRMPKWAYWSMQALFFASCAAVFMDRFPFNKESWEPGVIPAERGAAIAYLVIATLLWLFLTRRETPKEGPNERGRKSYLIKTWRIITMLLALAINVLFGITALNAHV